MKIIVNIIAALALAATAHAANICTCGPNSGTDCTTADADCGADFLSCCSDTENWDSGTMPYESVQPLFIGAVTGRDLTCGAAVGSCVTGSSVAAPGNECRSDNFCTATREVCDHCDADAECTGTCSCTVTGCSGTCSENSDECDGFCPGTIALDGSHDDCAVDADCVTRGRMLVNDQSLQYCGYDGLRYALQPRKFIHYRDTNCDGVDDCDDRDDRIGTSFEIAELETTVPATPDSNFFAVASGIVTVQRAGVYAVRAGVTPEFQGSKGGGLVLRGEVEQVEDACAASTGDCGSADCDYTDVSAVAFPAGGTSGPDITPTGTAALYIGSATYKESSLNIGLSTTGVLVLDRCDKVRITVKSTKIDDKRGKFYWKANQTHLYMEYLGGDEND